MTVQSRSRRSPRRRGRRARGGGGRDAFSTPRSCGGEGGGFSPRPLAHGRGAPPSPFGHPEGCDRIFRLGLVTRDERARIVPRTRLSGCGRSADRVEAREAGIRVTGEGATEGGTTKTARRQAIPATSDVTGMRGPLALSSAVWLQAPPPPYESTERRRIERNESPKSKGHTPATRRPNENGYDRESEEGCPPGLRRCFESRID